MKKVLIPTKLDKVVSEILSAKGFTVVQDMETPFLDLAKANPDTEALIIRSEKVTPEIMDVLPSLKLVVRAGAGYDNVDIKFRNVKNEKGETVKLTNGTYSYLLSCKDQNVRRAAFRSMLILVRLKQNANLCV